LVFPSENLKSLLKNITSDNEDEALKLLSLEVNNGTVFGPVGSPAFWHQFTKQNPLLDCLYSHTERVSEEKDGVKTSIFVHKHFILI